MTTLDMAPQTMTNSFAAQTRPQVNEMVEAAPAARRPEAVETALPRLRLLARRHARFARRAAR